MTKDLSLRKPSNSKCSTTAFHIHPVLKGCTQVEIYIIRWIRFFFNCMAIKNNTMVQMQLGASALIVLKQHQFSHHWPCTISANINMQWPLIIIMKIALISQTPLGRPQGHPWGSVDHTLTTTAFRYISRKKRKNHIWINVNSRSILLQKINYNAFKSNF